MNILLTGGSGFIGQGLLKSMSDCYNVTCIGRTPTLESDKVNFFHCDLTKPLTGMSGQFIDVDVVVHCAGRAHILNDNSPDPMLEFRNINVNGTINLAYKAAEAGVKRFIFISSVKVSGESTTSALPYNEGMEPLPEDACGQSKYEAEQALKRVASEAGLQLVIIRAPLVYGTGVTANFLHLLKLSAAPLPLPFGAIKNHRSMIYLGNLVDFIILCISHPRAANQTFLISDGYDVSLKWLISTIRKAMGRSPGLIPIPQSLFKFAGKLTDKKSFIDRLVGDLQVDSSKARQLLDWKPPYTVEQGIAKTVSDFNDRNK